MPIDIRRPTLAAIVAGFIAATVLAGPAAAVPDNVKPGGTLVVALSGDPEVLNSGITTDITSSNISGQVYSTIVRLDNDGNVKPDLAKSWEISPDGLTYTFKLFENIKWHDGVPFTAEDIVWGLQNVNKKYNGPSSGLLAPVESLTAPDKYTVVFKLKTAYPPLLRGLAYFNSSTILPKHIFDNGEDPRKNPANFKPIGTGPFIFKEYQKGDHVTFEKNPNYHLPGQPYVDRLIFQIIPNDAARAIALQKGDVDFIPYYAITLGQVEDLRKDPKVGTTIAKRMIAGEYMAFINTRNAPLDKKEVRQALYYAMNRADYLEKAGFGFGKISVGPISSEQPNFYTDKVNIYNYDPARAERMLDAAGLTRKADGKRFALRVSFDQKEGPMDDVARLMRANFARIGVDLTIQGMDTGAWTETAFRQWNYDITMGSFSTGPDPAIGVDRLYRCTTREKLLGRNASGYCNEQVDAWLTEAGKETDDAKRAVIYAKVQAQLAEDVPHFWLWDRYYPIAFNAGLVGLPQDPTAYGAFDTVGWKK